MTKKKKHGTLCPLAPVGLEVARPFLYWWGVEVSVFDSEIQGGLDDCNSRRTCV